MPTPDPQPYGFRVRWKHADIQAGAWQQVSFRKDELANPLADAKALCDYLDQVVLRRIADNDERILARVYLRSTALFQAPEEAPVGVTTVRTLVARYEATRSRSEGTQADYERIKKRYFADWLDQPAVAIDTADLARKYRELISREGFNLKPSTARTALNVVAPALRWGFRQGTLKTDPTAGCNFLTRGAQFFTNDKPITQLEFRAILRIAQGLARLIFWLLGETGIRLGELFALDVEDIDLERREVHIRHHMVKRVRERGTKSGAEAVRTVPIGRDLAEALAEHIGRRTTGPVFRSARKKRLGNPRFYREVWSPLVAAARHGKLISTHQPLHPHVMRHSFATWRAHSGKVTAFQLMRLMGHSQLTTTQHYFGDEAGAVDAGRDFLDNAA